MSKSLPTLFKKTPTGKIQTWKVELEPARNPKNIVVTVSYGAFKGKIMKHAEVVSEGKNIGKKNETTPAQQAEAEAKAKWNKQLKLGYVKKLSDAKEGVTDKIITGGVLPMLAEKFQDHRNKIKYPIMGQPKLNGMRCIAIKKNKKFTLWSRTRKPITSCPHIIEQLEAMTSNLSSFTFDGELYVHTTKMHFEKLMSAARKQKPSTESAKIEFHIYDCIVGKPTTFSERSKQLEYFPDYFTHIKFVETFKMPNLNSVEGYFEKLIKLGYEGLMLRNPLSFYEQKRTTALIKYKKMLDAEFEIIEFKAGESDSVVAYLKNPNSAKPIKATMSGNKKDNQEYLDDSWAYTGRMLTVQFQEYTNKNKVPLFPVGIRIREEE